MKKLTAKLEKLWKIFIGIYSYSYLSW